MHAELDAEELVARAVEGLAELLVGQTPEVQTEILRINEDVRPTALQIALLVPLLAGLLGVFNGFRMTRRPDPEPSSAAESVLGG